ncbi:C40 family peptidase [Orrella sp. 11846]|uniref:C40 family peptidase n=1 Tax=Orrella sp. 11846 TaxID=3409913 RepID=UPI003B5CF978
MSIPTSISASTPACVKNAVTGRDIVAEARKWLGVRWRHAGRNRQGIDCVGLGVVVTQALGICDYDVTAYSKEPNDELMAHFDRVADRIPVRDARPGDILVINFRPYPFHAAFLSEQHGAPHIIHAHAGARQVIEEPYTHDWPTLTSHAFRLHGVQP